MLKIHVKEYEFFNDSTNEFVTIPSVDLSLEHSLVSISKWESKWKKPFLNNTQHTEEELYDYIKCMTITQNVKEETFMSIKSQPELIKNISEYIDDKMTATIFNDRKQNINSNLPPRKSSKIITNEMIYYWMTQYGIPFECQTWHLNRLLTLIRIANVEGNSGNNKMSKRDVLSSNAALNQARRQQLKSRG